jgi:hypothetical protein
MLQVQRNTACNCIYIHTNITTCSVTQSQCPAFLFFNFINLFFKIQMYLSSAEFSGWLRLKGKSRKTFDTIISTKSVFIKFKFWGSWGGCSPAAPPPPPPGVPLYADHHYVSSLRPVPQAITFDRLTVFTLILAWEPSAKWCPFSFQDIPLPVVWLSLFTYSWHSLCRPSVLLRNLTIVMDRNRVTV